MSVPSNVFLQTSKWCAIIMFTISLITLAKVIKSTFRTSRQFIILYTILGLSVLTWTLPLMTYLTTNKVVYSLSLSYTAV
jgi:hypothetical protein